MGTRPVASLVRQHRQAGRIVDVRFYRAAYNDSDDLTDTELEANAEAGRLPAGRPLNPTEFVRRAVANGLLSSDFDPIGYRVHPAILILIFCWLVVSSCH
jgi:hypothetical protein